MPPSFLAMQWGHGGGQLSRRYPHIGLQKFLSESLAPFGDVLTGWHDQREDELLDNTEMKRLFLFAAAGLTVVATSAAHASTWVMISSTDYTYLGKRLKSESYVDTSSITKRGEWTYFNAKANTNQWGLVKWSKRIDCQRALISNVDGKYMQKRWPNGEWLDIEEKPGDRLELIRMTVPDKDILEELKLYEIKDSDNTAIYNIVCGK